ncbi:SWIM zinc finger domain-containing protein [Halogeometricum sp. S1BR25-6]|uniref:SWIM zinc finger domain-containing protein n=1 Tax=Halogeometricum salsisoli TaxID=2950536 RepID=A0ABU2GKL3_9EURY|nr:SWIM zinc finger family protein [Halogeometricum sp. S1BR25-6]MDS0301364.1 SWIM zinc finger domain-containing protein [Halogeometricum sp. S1BR25-6]
MDHLLPINFKPTSHVLKRAQYEAFAFSVLDGDIRVRNESHENPATHEYLVTVVNGIPATCECPADAAYEGPCKHRVAIAIRPRILELVTKVQVVADGGTRATDHYEPAESDQCECDKLDDGFPCWDCVRTGRKTLPET